MKNNKVQLSKEPYKGTRDFYPEDMYIQNYIFNKMRSAVEKFGYQEYGSTILEETALYKAKSGEEIVNEQTYSFTDRGGRDVTIRPEMTPTVARMIARKRTELAFPIRLYSIPNLFRYENPQKGRLREHWQLNVDMFGADNIDADAEILSTASTIMKELGATKDMYKIKISNRRLINYLFEEYFKLTEEQSYKLAKLIDKKKKITEEEFNNKLKEITQNKAKEILKILNIKKIEDFPAEIKKHKSVEEIEILLEKLKELEISNYEFDITLMRGFDYYTGIIFELFDTNKENPRSLFGGGRYDDLVGIFEVEKITGIGFGMGDVTIKSFLEIHKLLPTYTNRTKLYICNFGGKTIEYSQKLANKLRESGIQTEIDLTNKKIGAQISLADKKKITHIICIGEDEAKSGEYKLKNIITKEECLVNEKELIKKLK